MAGISQEPPRFGKGFGSAAGGSPLKAMARGPFLQGWPLLVWISMLEAMAQFSVQVLDNQGSFKTNARKQVQKAQKVQFWCRNEAEPWQPPNTRNIRKEL